MIRSSATLRNYRIIFDYAGNADRLIFLQSLRSCGRKYHSIFFIIVEAILAPDLASLGVFARVIP